MDQTLTWVQAHPMFITFVAVGCVVIPMAFAVDGHVLRWLLTASRGMRDRAIAVTLAWHLALLVAWCLVGVAALVLQSVTGSRSATAWVAIPAVLVLTPWTALHLTRTTSLPVADDLRQLGAPADVARAVAMTSAPLAALEAIVAVVALRHPFG